MSAHATFHRLLLLGVNHRWASLVFLCLVTVLLGLGLPRLQVDTGLSSLIPGADPDKLIYDQVAEEFGSDNRTLIYLRGERLWTPEGLTALEQLHRRVQALPFVQRVDDLYTLRSVRGEGEVLDARLLLAEVPAGSSEAEQARADALYNPLIVGNYLSQDGEATALMVTVREAPDDPTFDRRVSRALEDAIAPARTHFETVFQIGPPRISDELKSNLLRDLLLLGPLSALLLVVTLLLFFRGWFAALVPLATSILSIIWAFGLMGWVGIPLNILSAMIPSLVVVIGATEDTHMMAAYFRDLAEGGNSRADTTRLMMRHMGVPLLLTIFTTVMGFASNAFIGIEMIEHFALASTAALLANGIITLLLVPLLLSVIGPTRVYGRRTPGTRGRTSVRGLPGLAVRAFGTAHQHYARPVLLLTGALCAFFVYQASTLHVTNDPFSYFREDRPLLQHARQVQQDLAGIKVFFVSLESDRERAFLDPANLRRLAEIQAFIAKQGIFDSSISLADHLTLLNREFHGGDPNYHTLPIRRDLVAQYLLFLHRSDLDSYVSHDLRRANIVVRHNVSDSATLNRHIRELREVVAGIAGAELRGHVVGENLMINAAAETLLSAQAKSLGVLLVVIFLTVSAMFTSFRGGVIALIPSLVPIILMFGIMGLLDIPLNPGTAMVAVIAIGIAIDGTIHLFARYNDLCRRTADYTEAVRMTVREEAVPVVYTSLALALGFGILIFSNFTLVAQFGALAAATMLFSIFANLIITPIIMSRIRLVGLHQILALSSQKGVLDASPLFREMSDYQIRKAILISEMHEFDAKELLIEQGSIGRSMYLLLEGEVEVVRRDGGESRQIVVLTPGQVFGEIGFIRDTQRTADVRALTPVKVLRFDYEKIRKDLKFFPGIVARLNFNISGILGERLADVMEQRHATPKAGTKQ